MSNAAGQEICRTVDVIWEGPRIAIGVPDSWTLDLRSTPELLLLAWSPPPIHGDSPRALTMTLTAESLSADVRLPDWQRGAEDIMSRTFIDWQVLDLRRVSDSAWSFARLSRYAATLHDQVTVEQWVTRTPDWGLTLSVTGASSEYSLWADLGEEVARSAAIHA